MVELEGWWERGQGEVPDALFDPQFVCNEEDFTFCKGLGKSGDRGLAADIIPLLCQEAYRSRMEQLTQTLQPRNEELEETATGRPQGSRAEFCACPRGCIMQLGRFDDTFCDFCYCDTDDWPCPCDCGHGCPCHPCFPNLDLQGDECAEVSGPAVCGRV